MARRRRSTGTAPAAPGSPTRRFARFGELAAAATAPIDDHRSTAAYRRHAVARAAPAAPLERALHVSETATLYRLRVNGTDHGSSRAPGWARACSTCCASGSACPAPRTPASRASAGRARCCVDGALVCACLVLGAERGRARGRHRRGAADRRRASSPTCSRRSSTRARCSAASARPGSSWRCTTCSTATPHPTDLELREAISGNLCRCTGYGRILAAAQAVVAERSELRPLAAGDAGMTVTTTERGRATGLGHSADAPRRRARRSRAVRVLLRPVGRRHAVGPHPALAAPARAHPLDRHRPGARHPRRARRADRRRRARRQAPTASSTPTSRCSPHDVVRYIGEAVAAVAADHPETARRAARGHRRRLRGARAARRRRGGDHRRADPPRRQRVPPSCVIRHGDADGRRATVVVEGTYEVGMQDQAFMGPESGLAVPDRRRRRRPARVDPVAARRPRPGRRLPRPAATTRCG